MASNGITRTQEKWGSSALEAGFTIIPNHLLAMNQYLPVERQVSPTEMLVLLQILLAWWSSDRLPFPSKAAIAARAALSTRQVQRALSALESKGLLQRTARFSGGRGRMSNSYDPAGLVRTVDELAKLHPNIFKNVTESI